MTKRMQAYKMVARPSGGAIFAPKIVGEDTFGLSVKHKSVFSFTKKKKKRKYSTDVPHIRQYRCLFI